MAAARAALPVQHAATTASPNAILALRAMCTASSGFDAIAALRFVCAAEVWICMSRGVAASVHSVQCSVQCVRCAQQLLMRNFDSIRLVCSAEAFRCVCNARRPLMVSNEQHSPGPWAAGRASALQAASVWPSFCGPGARGDSSAVDRTAAGTAEGVDRASHSALARLSKNRAITRARTAVGARFTRIASVADQNYAAEQHPLAPRNEQQRRAAQARR